MGFLTSGLRFGKGAPWRGTLRVCRTGRGRWNWFVGMRHPFLPGCDCAGWLKAERCATRPRDEMVSDRTPVMRGQIEAGVRPSGHQICRTHQPSQPAQTGHTRGVEQVWGKRPGRVLRSFRCGTSVKMAEDRQTKKAGVNRRPLSHLVNDVVLRVPTDRSWAGLRR